MTHDKIRIPHDRYNLVLMDISIIDFRYLVKKQIFVIDNEVVVDVQQFCT